MQIDNRRPVYVPKIHCLRPQSLRNSHLTQPSSIAYLNSAVNSTVMNQPPGTNQTTFDLNSTLTQHDSQDLLNSTAEQADLLTFVESFPLNFPNFRRPSPRPPMRSRQLSQISRLDQIRQQNQTREQVSKTRFVAARTTTRKDGHSQLLETMRRCRLSKPGKVNTAARLGGSCCQWRQTSSFAFKERICGATCTLWCGPFTRVDGGGPFSGPYETSYHQQGHHINQ